MKPPTMQIVIDCHGEAVTMQHLDLLRHHAMHRLGYEDVRRTVFVTRTDLLHDLADRVYASHVTTFEKIEHEFRHEPSFDLYLPGEIVPIGRLVNVKVPEK